MVDSYRPKYNVSERSYKHQIIEEVLSVVKSNGGRFLEKIDDFSKSYWSEVEHSVAYRKIGHAFRSNARKLSAQRRENGSGSNNKRKNETPPMPPHVAAYFAAGGGGPGVPPFMGANFGGFTNHANMGISVSFGMPQGNPMIGMMMSPGLGPPGATPFYGDGMIGVFAPAKSEQLSSESLNVNQGLMSMPSSEGDVIASEQVTILTHPASEEPGTAHVAPHNEMQFPFNEPHHEMLSNHDNSQHDHLPEVSA